MRFFVQEAMGSGNACDGLTKHDSFNWWGVTGFLHVSSDPSQGENMKDSQRLEPQFTVFIRHIVIDWLDAHSIVIDCFHSIFIDICT